jgi:hypothetical protein
VADSPEAVAYEQAMRSVADQEATLDGLRSRAGTLLSAASLSTSFLAALGIKDQPLTGLAWLAIGLFLAMGVCAGLVLWPWDGWKFGMDTYKVVEEYVDGNNRLPVDEMKRDLALHPEENIQKNRTKLDRLFYAYEAGMVLLLAEVVVWLGVLARG